MTEQSLEDLTQHYGRALFDRIPSDRPMLFSLRWWDELMLALTMSEPALKVQLFRFIDVLPNLRDEHHVAQHLRDYLQQAVDRLPFLLRTLIRWMPTRGLLAQGIAKSAQTNVTRMARRFISGSNLREALSAIQHLRRHSLAFTIDLLGEAVLTDSEAARYQKQTLDLLQGLTFAAQDWESRPLIDRDHAGAIPRINLSLKLSSLYSQFDPIDSAGTCAEVKERLRPILYTARLSGAFVNIDMEQYAYKDITLRIFREILLEPDFRDWKDVGIALQAYLQSSGADLRLLRKWVDDRGTPVWVRLVKGAYWDYEITHAAQNNWSSPVYLQKHATDANYEEQTRFLLENYESLRPALATHNIRSLARTLALAELLRVPAGAFEFQMLYGMGDTINKALVGLNQRVRVYTPFGDLLPGMAYLVRRLLENTANQSFLRASFIEHVPEDKLLLNPKRNALVEEFAEESSTRFQNEPVTDFSREEAQSAMQAALAAVAGQLNRYYPLVIAGKNVTCREVECFNPSHVWQRIGRVASATIDEARRAVMSAKESFPAWRDTPVSTRVALLRRTAELLRERRFELSAWEINESGTPWREADADVAEAIDFCEYYAFEMERLCVPNRRDVPGENNETIYEPRGVAVVIAPWNFPLAILCGMTTAALVTGNTVIMKPSEQASIVAAKFMEVLQAAGFPPGVVHYLPGKGEEVGPILTNHRDVDLIAFTGSQAVGLLINRQAAETPEGQDHVKRVIAEMGGKNAILVDDDADLDEAIHGVVASAFDYQGQKCSACSRVIVMNSIHEAFVSRLIEATQSLKLAPAEDPACTIGPVIDRESKERITLAIEQGQRDAKQVYGGEAKMLADEGWYVVPHIFTNVPLDSSLAQDEIFGPVLAVCKAANLDEALRIANGTRYALTGGLYSRSPENIAKVRREFRVGNLYLNRKITGALVDRQPFGGFKLSGVGSKAGGPDYLLQFVLPRTITENTMRHGFVPETSQHQGT
jgi:RHH-type proline utilization regulon transcriptional repressor/proline dehydrogenase/delta 1-pyrroline-5-carboxylate dehydrogenase